jgi:hypothetical protein
MNSEGRLLDPSSRVYRTIGDDGNDMNVSLSNTMRSLTNNSDKPNKNPYPASRRYGSASFANRSKMTIAMSPSSMSLGGTSIWDDASVRGDSPEPEMPAAPSPIPSRVLVEVPEPQPQRISKQRTPTFVIGEFDPEAYENMGTGGMNVAMETWERDRNRFTATPQGKGLGLRVGNATLGTPGSLYDRDGFLNE